LDDLKEARRYWNWRRKLRIALFGELSLEVAMDLSQDRQLLDLSLAKCRHLKRLALCVRSRLGLHEWAICLTMQWLPPVACISGGIGEKQFGWTLVLAPTRSAHPCPNCDLNVTLAYEHLLRKRQNM
jgi:hypothetical protein